MDACRIEIAGLCSRWPEKERARMHAIWRRGRFAAAATLLLLSTLLLGLSPASAVAEEDKADATGHVYVLNNNLFGANSITSFARTAHGTLTQTEVTDIGGQGSLAAFADGTQASLIRTRDAEPPQCISTCPGALNAHPGDRLFLGPLESGST